MKTAPTIALVILLSQAVFGTTQYPDEIIYKGQAHELRINPAGNPMEIYFEKFPDKRPKNGVMPTNLQRGYAATFETKDNQLYLKDIKIRAYDSVAKESNWKSVVNELFPNQKEVKIDWMTGIIVIPIGKALNRTYAEYASMRENYILLEIDKGNLTKEMQFDYKEYKEFKEKQFQAFKKTDEYEKKKSDFRKEDSSYVDERIDEFLKYFVMFYSSKILVE